MYILILTIIMFTNNLNCIVLLVYTRFGDYSTKIFTHDANAIRKIN